MAGFADYLAQISPAGSTSYGGPGPIGPSGMGMPMSSEGMIPSNEMMTGSPPMPPMAPGDIAQALPGLQMARDIIDMILVTAQSTMSGGPMGPGPGMMPPPGPTNISPTDLALLNPGPSPRQMPRGMPGPRSPTGRPPMQGPAARPMRLPNTPRTPGM